MTSKLQLDIPVLLTDAADDCARCVNALVRSLLGRPGVLDVHVVREGVPSAGKLCIHYDPELLSLSRIDELARAADAHISRRYAHRVWRLSGVPNARAARRLAHALNRTHGVLHPDASVAGLAAVEFDREQVTQPGLVAAIASAGANVVGEAAPVAPPEAPVVVAPPVHPERLERIELWFAVAAGLATGLGWALQWGGQPLVSIAMYVAAYAFGGVFTVREAWENLRQRRFDIDTLMVFAAAGAAALGAWAEGALLLFLFSLGHAWSTSRWIAPDARSRRLQSWPQNRRC